MLTAGEVAGLIVAMFWAILVCFLAVVLVMLARLLIQATKIMADLNDRVIPLIDDVGLAVAEANRQLVTVEAIAGDMKEVSGNLVTVSGVASTLFAKPLIKVSALVYGLRRAVTTRRAPRPAIEGRRRP